ncbi:MAG: regulatory protein RecX [Clostridia bacterium]|nr:regulatory protein RecX [Clostridia bacterium]
MDKVLSVERKNGVATVRFLSGETVRVPSALYLERRLRAGDSADPAAYRMFISQRGYPHALETAMKFLALRERSEKEVRDRLRRSSYDAASIQRVIDTLQLHGLLSDGRFAEQWVSSRSKKYGRGRIAQELRVKGVSGQEAQQALNALPEEEEYRRAVEQGRKMARKFKNDAKKITQALMRRGYGYALAKKAAEEAARD